MTRRTSSTLVRKWCFEFWCRPWGITRVIDCYLCGRLWEERDWAKCEAEHEIPRALGLARFGAEIDRPPNVKPCCAGTCERHSQQSAQSTCASSQTKQKSEESALSQYSGHKEKTKADVKRIAKTNRIDAKHSHFRRSANPLPGSKRSHWKKQYNKSTGRWETVRRDA